jgi:hypothetical protein
MITRTPVRGCQDRGRQRGAILLYLIVSIIAVGLLGAAAVSLTTSSQMSTTAQNAARRASYNAESGLHYAMGEIRRQTELDGLPLEIVLGNLNGQTFSIDGQNSFTITTYGLWLKATQNRTIIPGNANKDLVELELPGKIDDEFYDAFSKLDSNADKNKVDSYVFVTNNLLDPLSQYVTIRELNPSADDPTRVTAKLGLGVKGSTSLDMYDGMYLYFAVLAEGNHKIIAPGETMQVSGAAWYLMPRRKGLFTTKGSDNRYRDYTYEFMSRDEKKGEVFFHDIRPASGGTVDIDIGNNNDLIVLTGSTQGQLLLSVEGASATRNAVTTTRSLDSGFMGSISPPENPDIAFASATDWDAFTDNPAIQSDGASIIKTEVEENGVLRRTIDLGAHIYHAFGAIWYTGDKYPNHPDYGCQAGECRFRNGYRTTYRFSLMPQAGAQADGITFTTMNAEQNGTDSVGGASKWGELVGYAGDGRIYSDTGDDIWLDPEQNGLQPPKFALEFDTWYNYAGMCYPPCQVEEARCEPGPEDHFNFAFWNDVNLGCDMVDPAADFSGKYLDKGKQEPANAAGQGTFDDNRHEYDPSGDFSFGNEADTKLPYTLVGNYTKSSAETPDGPTFFPFDDPHIKAGPYSPPQSPQTSSDWRDWLSTRSQWWALRMEVHREPDPADHAPTNTQAYRLRAWLAACDDRDCTNLDADNADIAEFHEKFSNTRRNLFIMNGGSEDQRYLILDRTVEIPPSLDGDAQNDFERYIFGWTQATGGHTQRGLIEGFELSFIRDGDYDPRRFMRR